MHLWIAATIAFCCVIFTETQAQRVGGFDPVEINKEIEKLAEEALEKINVNRDSSPKFKLIRVYSAGSQDVAGFNSIVKLSVLKLLVTLRPCGYAEAVMCPQQNKICVWTIQDSKGELLEAEKAKSCEL